MIDYYLSAGANRGFDDGRCVKVTRPRRRRADANGLISGLDVEAVAVGVAVHGDGS